MKRISQLITLAAVLTAALTLAAAASPRHERGPGGGRGRALMHCLMGLDLTDAQKADIKTAREAAKPTLEADREAIKAARQKLRADAEAGADKSVIGQDFLNVRAAGKKARGDREALKDQVLGKLTGDQKTQLQDCLGAARQRGGTRQREFSN